MILRAALALACLAARVAGQLRGPRPTTSGTPKPTGASQRKKVCDDLDEAGNPIYINFVKHEFGRAMTQAKSMLATDLDGDGDVDVLVAYISDPDSSGREGFHWYEADPSKSDGYRWREVEYGVPGASAIHAGDIDGDGMLDVLTGTEYATLSRIAWYNNVTRFESTKTDTYHDRNAGDTEWHNTKFSDPQVIDLDGDSEYGKVRGVWAADVDGDGEVDVLAAINGEGKLAYYHNDGSETFGVYTRLNTNDMYYVTSVFPVDVDGNGKVDVVASSELDISSSRSEVAWYENNGEGGASTTFTEHIITHTLTNAIAAYAIDFDEDGHVDLLAASSNDGRIAIYQNTAGTEDFAPTDGSTTERIITVYAGGASSLDVADFDGDENLDVLFAGSNLGGYIDKAEAKNGIPTEDGVRGCGSTGSGCQEMIVYYLNKGQTPLAFEEYRIANLDDATGPQYFVQAIDVDGDGDVDAVFASLTEENIRWYENDCAASPTFTPTADFPTGVPTALPSSRPSPVPISEPTAPPTTPPSSLPTSVPTTPPSPVPTVPPTAVPTAAPTTPPSPVPTVPPTAVPTGAPTSEPTGRPTVPPTALPTGVPTTLPSSVPTVPPTPIPAPIPTPAPTPRPSVRCSAGVTFSTEHDVEASGRYLNVHVVDGAKIKVARRLPRPSARRRGTG